jgi:hypothetical protein
MGVARFRGIIRQHHVREPQVSRRQGFPIRVGQAEVAQELQIELALTEPSAQTQPDPDTVLHLGSIPPDLLVVAGHAARSRHVRDGARQLEADGGAYEQVRRRSPGRIEPEEDGQLQVGQSPASAGLEFHPSLLAVEQLGV